MLGGPGDDTIVGAGAADFFSGGAGSDVLKGGRVSTPLRGMHLMWDTPTWQATMIESKLALATTSSTAAPGMTG